MQDHRNGMRKVIGTLGLVCLSGMGNVNIGLYDRYVRVILIWESTQPMSESHPTRYEG